MIRDIQFAAQIVRPRDVLRFAGAETGVFFSAPVATLAPKLHGDADDLMSLRFQQCGGNRGIHPAGKSDRDLQGKTSSIRSMGAFAFLRISSSSSILGARSRRAKSTSSSVIFFMFGQTTAGSSG